MFGAFYFRTESKQGCTVWLQAHESKESSERLLYVEPGTVPDSLQTLPLWSTLSERVVLFQSFQGKKT